MTVYLKEGSSSTVPEFCLDCGTILPYFNELGVAECFNCKRSYKPEDLDGYEMTYVVNFNTYTEKSKEEKDKIEGPVVERRCPKCNNNKMSYATLQLRSADEGQTVFYTCTKCKHKETENS
ncbi:RNA polymerase I subunit RpI12 [Rhodnius prolixus]|uniref:DNA-directed RNA polymerase subunit n=2 Tax=Rhodnius TaxID=13248 RepID=R4G7X7_RHOPR